MQVIKYLTVVLGFTFLSSCQEQEPLRPPQSEWRIITMGPSTASLLVTLGLKENIVGVSEWCSVQELNHVSRIGSLSAPSIEKIIALEPNIVLGQGSQKALEEFCKNYDIYYHQFNTDNIKSWEEEVLMLGNTFNKNEEALDLVATLNKNFPNRGIDKNAPSCLIVASRKEYEIGGLLVAGRSSFLSELVERVGGANIVEDDSDYIYLQNELLLELDPDIIIELHPTEVSQEAIKNLWKERFPGLKARLKIISNEGVLMPGSNIMKSASLLKQAIQE